MFLGTLKGVGTLEQAVKRRVFAMLEFCWKLLRKRIKKAVGVQISSCSEV